VVARGGGRARTGETRVTQGGLGARARGSMAEGRRARLLRRSAARERGTTNRDPTQARRPLGIGSARGTSSPPRKSAGRRVEGGRASRPWPGDGWTSARRSPGGSPARYFRRKTILVAPDPAPGEPEGARDLGALVPRRSEGVRADFSARGTRRPPPLRGRCCWSMGCPWGSGAERSRPSRHPGSPSARRPAARSPWSERPQPWGRKLPRPGRPPRRRRPLRRPCRSLLVPLPWWRAASFYCPIRASATGSSARRRPCEPEKRPRATEGGTSRTERRACSRSRASPVQCTPFVVFVASCSGSSPRRSLGRGARLAPAQT